MKAQAKSLLVVALCGLATGSTLAELKANYVGQGRYSCSGTAVECAQINSNNDRNAEWNRRRHQEEQDRAQRYVEENRRREHWEKRGFSEITIQIELHFAMTFVVGSIIANWLTELTPRLPVGKTGHDIAKLTGVKQKKPRPKLSLAQRRSNLKGLTTRPQVTQRTAKSSFEINPSLGASPT